MYKVGLKQKPTCSWDFSLTVFGLFYVLCNMHMCTNIIHGFLKFVADKMIGTPLLPFYRLKPMYKVGLKQKPTCSWDFSL